MQKTIGTVNAHETNLKRKGPSKTAELMAFNRVVESAKPEGERICYDSYAIRFIGPEYLKFLKVLASDPDKAKASREQMERLYPGVHNSIVARVRYFDDSVRTSIKEGLEQLVILGAGYDTRAYRIEGLKDTVRVFEVDHPDTQKMKMEKIKEIFGSLPDYIAYIPVDLTTEDFG